MKQEVAEKWVAELRSGKYQQTKEKLRAVTENHSGELVLSSRFCCLGVLCNLFAQEQKDAEWGLDEKNAAAYFTAADDDADDENLPAFVQEWAAMYSPIGCLRVSSGPEYETLKLKLQLLSPRAGILHDATLASANDRGASFEQIADFIEQHWQNL